jgi:hypothetical protein
LCILWLLSRGIEYRTRTISVNGKKLVAQVADTPRKMTVGLMFRTRMKANECMLFIFPEPGNHPIWAHNMKFAIDVVWCDRSGRVVDYFESMKPSRWFDFGSHGSEEPSKYVIEFNSGFVKKSRLKKGTRILLGK